MLKLTMTRRSARRGSAALLAGLLSAGAAMAAEYTLSINTALATSDPL